MVRPDPSLKARVHWADFSPVRLFWRQSQPSVGRKGINHVRWPVSKKSLSAQNPLFLRTPVSRLTYLTKNGLVDTGLKPLFPEVNAIPNIIEII